MKALAILLPLALSLCPGCATHQRETPIELRSRSFAASREAVFGACLLVMADKGYAIQSADSGAGVILTDWMPFPSSSGEFSCPARSKYNVIVTDGEGSTNVSLNLFLEKCTSIPFSPWERVPLREDREAAVYRQVLDAVGNQVATTAP